MADDDVTPLNPPIAPIEEEGLEEKPFDVNVSQRLCDEKSFEKMVRTQADYLAWDRQLFPNPHALTIYLKFVPAHGVALERFEECQCEYNDVHLNYRTWVPGDGHYHWLRGPINPLSMEHRIEYLARTIRRIMDFL